MIEDIEKRRKVPFPSWGGAGTYAADLAKMFPEHRVYCEPFCGSAALLFAKERSRVEAIADMDADLVFTMQFIQRMTDADLDNLRKFNWTSTRSRYDRMHTYEPTNEYERVYHFLYGRNFSWSGKHYGGGYSTYKEGRTFDPSELMEFKKRLQGVQIARRD